MITPEETGKAYDQITSLWTREDYPFQYGIAQHKRAIQFTIKNDAQHSKFALDVGCGCTGRFIDLLTESGYTAEGLDVSAEMIRLAREKQPHIRFHHQDILSWQPEKQYDFITAWDSIWHLPLSQQTPVMTKLTEMLNPGGILIFSFGGVEDAGEHQNSTMGPRLNHSSLGTNGFIQLLIACNCIIRHLEFDQYPELHTYLIVEKAMFNLKKQNNCAE